MFTDVKHSTNATTQEVSTGRCRDAAVTGRRGDVPRGGVGAGLGAPRGSAPHARRVREAESQPPPVFS